MNQIRIEEPNDARVTAYRDIKERDLVGRQERFVAEGKVVLEILLRSERFIAESILLLERRLPLLAGALAERPDVPAYIVNDEVMNQIAGFDVHRGILAIGRRNTLTTPEDLVAAQPEKATLVVCAGISNHDNIGSIFRNAAAFGAGGVLLDQTCCDPLYRKALRVSVGAVLKVPFARFDALDDLPDMLDRLGFRQFALSPGGSTDIGAVAPGGKVALYVGAEGPGLPAAILQRIHSVRIPISKEFDSLNAAAATAIALHHFPVL
ncbi:MULTISPECIES: TrmH family RNA methyltransferase [Mesorhizobium]|uniref:RNA methyltransferase n=1 Tax=Mesorhizobium denitrificans TaxID=2294114 RepID=A0A371XJU5_9HYPH|nr:MULTISPECIES: RNA methyltransferase [Mesorhizobium]RFC69483.1 RNA methyltransferase [Mesorhizobium denitrificans]